ncbi:MAG: hypothetical protein Q7T82_15455 [Armatimonadota bacterium]|nr:hypothetical protein [Armatimonadota bacterium]
MVDVPKQLKPGKYAMEVFIDTKSKLGVLSAKRQVTIVGPTPAQEKEAEKKPVSCRPCGNAVAAS